MIGQFKKVITAFGRHGHIPSSKGVTLASMALALLGWGISPSVVSAQTASSCAGFNAALSANVDGFQSTSSVTTNGGDSITGFVNAPAGSTVTIFYLAGQDSVNGSGTFVINVNSTGGASSGTVDVQFANLGTGGNASVTINCTPGSGGGGTGTGTTSTGSDDTDGVDLSGPFPESETGDLTGKYNIIWQDEDEDTVWSEDDEESSEEDDLGSACQRCQAVLTDLNNQLRSALRTRDRLKATKASIQSGNEDALRAEGLDLSSFVRNHPEYETLRAAEAALDREQETMAGFIRNNPDVALAVGLTQGSRGPTGGSDADVQGYLDGAFSNFGDLYSQAQQAADLADIELDWATMDGFYRAVTTGAGVPAALPSDPAVSPHTKANAKTPGKIAQLWNKTVGFWNQTGGRAMSATEGFRRGWGLAAFVTAAMRQEAARNGEQAARFAFNRIREGRFIMDRLQAANRAATELRNTVFDEAEAQQRAAMEQRLAELNEGIFNAEKAINRLTSSVRSQNNRCQIICGAVVSTKGEARKPAVFFSQSPKGVGQSRSASRMGMRFDLRQWRRGRVSTQGGPEVTGVFADRRFNLFFGSTISQTNDSSAQDLDGLSFSIAGGVSWQFTSAVTGGVALSLSTSELDGSDRSNDSTAYSLGTFVQTKLPNDIRFEGVLSYGVAHIDEETGSGATKLSSETQARSLAAQVKLSKVFEVGGFNLTPQASISGVRTMRDGYERSDGRTYDDQIDVNWFGNGGLAISGSFVSDNGRAKLSPSANLAIFKNFSDDGAPGASASFGLAVETVDGMHGNFGLGLVRVSDDKTATSLSFNWTIPLGR